MESRHTVYAPSCAAAASPGAGCGGPVPEHDEVARLGRADAGKREPREQALGPARHVPRKRGRAAPKPSLSTSVWSLISPTLRIGLSTPLSANLGDVMIHEGLARRRAGLIGRGRV